MREIKFRAWDKDLKEMLKWNEIRSWSMSTLNKHETEYNEVPMQYTGLTDKNGVEIYEGDICRCYGGTEFNGYFEYNRVYEVKWQGSGFDMVIDDCGYGWNFSSCFDYVEVIGNIYENSELLKDEE